MVQGVCELLWMKIVLDVPRIKYEVNKSVISIAHNSVQHDRTKHIEVDQHFIEEKLESSLIATTYITSGLQLPYMFIKGLTIEWFQYLTSWKF